MPGTVNKKHVHISLKLFFNLFWLYKMDTEYKFLKEIDCKQGAVRSVRFSGEYLNTYMYLIHKLIIIVLERWMFMFMYPLISGFL